ncbi:transporter [Aquincola tertiaricarbonis]|uniref:Transporter n=1 Tax=Aquincola tertiaricarbonis TaxID=391953 RepID=A0ABY4S1N3_AQUTE|nr:transporter [Aquincola tertiaricarbonis]URI06859.1 transporter [Aquincola tertiaricarbonis]
MIDALTRAFSSPLPGLGLVLAAACGSSLAAEGGGSAYPSGVETWLAGAVPPPGHYLLMYGNSYRADTLRDGRGDSVPVRFRLGVDGVTPRYVWSTPMALGGGNLVLQALLPLLHIKAEVAGASQSTSGPGDLALGAAVAWHHSPVLHSVAGANIILPTGSYDAADLVNLGRHYTTLQPTYAVSRVDAAGLNADLKLTLNLNGRNSDTRYRTGTELFADYALGWGVGGGWVLGMGGHVRTQLQDDRQDGVSVDDSRTRSWSIGPSVKYETKQGWFIAARWQQDQGVRNGPQGHTLWIKTVLPL